jgi:hypothetical protein
VDNLQAYKHKNPHTERREYTTYEHFRVIKGAELKKYITAKTKVICQAIL